MTFSFPKQTAADGTFRELRPDMPGEQGNPWPAWWQVRTKMKFPASIRYRAFLHGFNYLERCLISLFSCRAQIHAGPQWGPSHSHDIMRKEVSAWGASVPSWVPANSEPFAAQLRGKERGVCPTSFATKTRPQIAYWKFPECQFGAGVYLFGEF